MTIKEIAKIANVSQATVSLALNNRPGVSDDTRNKIIQIANQYGYIKKNNSRTKKQNILFIKYIGSGVAIEQNGDFIARIIDSIEESASNLNYNITIKNIIAKEFDTTIKFMSFDEYEGIIFLGTEADTKDIIYLRKNVKIPIVAVDNIFGNYDIDTVLMDNYGGIDKAIKHLTSLGHRKIGYIDSTLRFENFNNRTEAYHKSLSKYRLEKNQSILYVDPSLEGAYMDTIKYLKKGIKGEITAFVAANDTIAIGAVKALREFGIKIPAEVSIIGFDDIPFCSMLDKTLTTIKVDKEGIGSLAVNLLDNKINYSFDATAKILVTTELIKRESTSKPI